jgi:hypothetical protein
VAALVVAGGCLGVAYVAAPDDRTSERAATSSEAPARTSDAPARAGTPEANDTGDGTGTGDDTDTGTAPPWTAHHETAMDAVLVLPSGYYEFARQGSADDPPRLVEYEDIDNDVSVRLTGWERAPRSPMAEAQQAHADWNSYEGDARTQYTRTSFHGQEAVLADTTYGMSEEPTRVMQLIVRTDDGGMYELRVDMPKGTAEEKEGTALFKGVRARLVLGTP